MRFAYRGDCSTNDAAEASYPEVARGTLDGTRWSLNAGGPGPNASIALRYFEPLTKTSATVPVPDAAAPITTTPLRSFLAGATIPEGIRVRIEGPDISPIDVPATGTDVGGGRRAAVWIAPLPPATVARTLTVSVTDADGRELARLSVEQALTVPVVAP